jgi:lysophospholipase L1-like esterase
MRRLIDIVRGTAYPLGAEPPEILIVAPPALRETADPDFAAMFEGGVAESEMLASFYSDLADDTACGFFDAGSVVETTPVDGVHLDARSTRALGRALEPIVRMMLGL